MSLTTAAANRVLDWINGVGSPTRATTPLKVRLVSAVGNATTAGTELATGAGDGVGAGYTAGGISVTFGSGSGASGIPTGDLDWENLDSVAISGIEIWDSAATPFRWQYAALPAVRVLSESSNDFRLPAATFATIIA